MNVIEVENLNFSYDNNPVIKDLSISFATNQYHCIIGNNGSGKSTLAKLIAGVLPFSSGEIKIDNQQSVGLVFQNPDNQFVTDKVKYDLAFGLENMNIKQTDMDGIIQRIAKELDIEKLLELNTYELSGGQKQRVAIASMLCMERKIVILDEATSMLDPRAKNKFLTYIKKYAHENNITIISITHDLDEAAEADNVVVLEDGAIKLSGAPKDVFSDDKLDDSLKPFYYNFFKELDLTIINDDDLEELLCKLN